MNLIDTSVWIEFLRQHDKKIDEEIGQMIEGGTAIALSPIFGELLQGVKNEREETLILSLWENLPKLNEIDLFIESGRISFVNKLFDKGVGLIDCAILFTAKSNNLTIWTLDKKLLTAAKDMEIEVLL